MKPSKPLEPVERIGYTAKEAATYLGVCERSLKRWAKAGKVPSVKLGRRRIFPKTVLDAWLARLAK